VVYKKSMDDRIKNIIGITVIVALVALIFGVLQYTKSAQPSRTFSVTGQSKVVVVPDIAQFSFGVVSEGGNDIAALQEENTQKANAIIEFLKAQGIEDKDIQTQNYSIEPRYQYASCPFGGICPPPEVIGYTIRNQVTVKIRDFSKISSLLAGTVERGANSVSQIYFTVDNIEELQQQAKTEAIGKAREEAEAVAKAGGFRLGKLVSLQEGGFAIPVPIYGVAEGRGGAGPIVEPGSQEVQGSVTLTYEIR